MKVATKAKERQAKYESTVSEPFPSNEGRYEIKAEHDEFWNNLFQNLFLLMKVATGLVIVHSLLSP